MKYLKIENSGIAPSEAFTLLGASTKREEITYKGFTTIGTFGSGAKHALTVLLRHGIKPVIFASNLKMEFDTKDQEVTDDISSASFARVMVKYGGKDETGRSRTSTEDLGFVVDYGMNDWTSIGLALREYVSNAIDHSIKYNEYHGNGPLDGCVIEEVEENQVRAKKGVTRVFVPLLPDVHEFFANLGRWFLHFSQPECLNQTVLKKANRNLAGGNAAVIYRRGVRVREVHGTNLPSLFDYNLEELQLDESRQVSDWSVQNEAARALRDADTVHLHTLLKSFGEGRYWEHHFQSLGLNNDWYDTTDAKLERSKKWASAMEELDDCVLVDEEQAELVSRKGFKPVVVPEAYQSMADDYGLRTKKTILSQDEREGREILPSTLDAITAVDFIWEQVESLGMTGGKQKPEVKGFHCLMHAESELRGFYRDGVVYIHTDLGKDGSDGDASKLSNDLLFVAMEEVGHFCTGSTDNSRDFQEYFIRMSVKLMRREQSNHDCSEDQQTLPRHRSHCEM